MRNDSDPAYNVRDATGDLTYPMFEEECEFVLDRARTPREDHPDAHIEQDLQPVLDRHGEDADGG